MFKRIIDHHLDKWKVDPFRKPLILRGARQVGKAYAVRRLSRQFKSFVEINFERLEGAATLFEKDLAPDRLILALSLLRACFQIGNYCIRDDFSLATAGFLQSY